jgi:hypothetical protein
MTAFLRSEPIAPKHQSPKGIDGPLVTDEDRRVFSDFKDFADVVNEWFAREDPPFAKSPWRLQELEDTLLHLPRGFYDMPKHGRRYEVYHNQFPVGTLEVSPAWQPNNIKAEIHVNYARYLSIWKIRQLFGVIATLMCERSRRSYLKRKQRSRDVSQMHFGKHNRPRNM